MKNSSKIFVLVFVGLAGLAGWVTYNSTKNESSAPATSSTPLQGLTGDELAKFRECEQLFTHKFTIEEGLGPLYNRKSCYDCHGSPGTIGGEGQSINDTELIYIADLKSGSTITPDEAAKQKFKISSKQVDFLLEKGGPFLYRRSITDEPIKGLEPDCKLDAIKEIPKAQFISHRHAPPLFGMGLIAGIMDDDLDDHEDDETGENVDMAGRSIDIDDPLTGKQRIGRFGNKTQQPTLINMVSYMMNAGPAISTPLYPERVPPQEMPRCLMPVLASEPNDMGVTAAKLIYYLMMMDAPPRGEITPAVTRGEKVFEKLQCAFCHTPEMQTAPKVRVIDPSSPAPKFKYYHSEALSDKKVPLYSDLLLHYMGEELADGIPQGKAGGGEWRTPPLWGLRFRKFLLHDGRANSIEAAIKLHGGQGSESAAEFSKLTDSDRKDLMAFLKSL